MIPEGHVGLSVHQTATRGTATVLVRYSQLASDLMSTAHVTFTASTCINRDNMLKKARSFGVDDLK